MPTVLTIAGSDPSGGAGIQADLKTFEAFGVKGLSAITALTAQTQQEVMSTNPVSADILTQQLFSVAKGEHIDAVKIGMIGSAANVHAIIMFIRMTKPVNVVIDPVFVSTSGTPLLEAHAMQNFKNELLPLATLITPNLDEAGTLTGMRIWNIGTMKEAARQIYAETWSLKAGRKNGGEGGFKLAVLVKGGHLTFEPTDLLYDGKAFTEFPAKRIAGKAKHGTGCRLSSAIACGLANGAGLNDSIIDAKKYVEKYIGGSS